MTAPFLPPLSKPREEQHNKERRQHNLRPRGVVVGCRVKGRHFHWLSDQAGDESGAWTAVKTINRPGYATDASRHGDKPVSLLQVGVCHLDGDSIPIALEESDPEPSRRDSIVSSDRHQLRSPAADQPETNVWTVVRNPDLREWLRAIRHLDAEPGLREKPASLGKDLDRTEFSFRH